jgi:hypothetical protein
MTIERSYVIDLAVHDFDGAAGTIGAILGHEGYRMVPEANPTGELDGIHFPVGGINALGIMALKGGPKAHPGHYMTDFLESHGDGICILGHLVDDIDKQVKEFESRGVSLASPEPMPYSDGRLIFTTPVRGASFEFAQHHDHGVTELWDARKAAASNPRVSRAYRVDIVVDDLEAATAEFENFLAIRSVSATEDRGSGLVGVDFPIGGLDALGLVALDGSKRGPIADAVASFQSKSGEGPMMLGFHVDDLDRTQSDLQGRGVEFLLPSPIRTGEGRSNFTRPVYGVTFEFTER